MASYKTCAYTIRYFRCLRGCTWYYYDHECSLMPGSIPQTTLTWTRKGAKKEVPTVTSAISSKKTPLKFSDENRCILADASQWLLVTLKHFGECDQSKGSSLLRVTDLALSACIYIGNDFALAQLWQSECTCHIHKWITSAALTNWWVKLLWKESKNPNDLARISWNKVKRHKTKHLTLF